MDIDLEDNPPVGELEATFNRAAGHLQTLISSLAADKLLYFYGRYKQANEGDCSTNKPGIFSYQARQKWDAWIAQKGKSKEAAMKEYIEGISNIDPDWELKAKGGDGPKTGWVTVSSLAKNTEEKTISDAEKTPFDWVKENNLQKLKSLDSSALEIKDEDGMSLLHWAADRDYPDILLYLINKIDINVQDADGQTALHYAASCGHLKALNVLMDNGASQSMKDNEGLVPVDCVEDAQLRSLFKD